MVEGVAGHGADFEAGAINDGAEAEEQHGKDNEHAKMLVFEPADGTHEADKGEHGGDNDDGIHTDALPVAAAEVQPHAEFIEGEAKGDAIEERGEFGFFAGGPAEHAVAADCNEQENAVVQVVDVGFAHEEVHVRHSLAHDEKDEDAGEDEGADEAEKRDAREFVRGLARDALGDVLGVMLGVFRVRVVRRHRA